MKKEKEGWWKSRPYWLKGGLIGIVIAFLWFLGLLICAEEFKHIEFGGAGCIAFFIPTLLIRKITGPLYLLLYNIGLIEKFDFMINLWILLGNILFFSLIGVLSGWIFGKIKSRVIKK